MLPTIAYRAHRRATARLTLIGLTLAALVACGTPPQPPPTSPPVGSPSFDPSASGPAVAVPGAAPALPGATGAALPPTYAVPTYVPPAYVPPANVPPVVPAPTTPVRTTPAVPPAPRCRTGPTAAQVLGTLRDQPGVPDVALLMIKDGPFCARDWQYATAALISDPNAKREDLLLIVTRGKPTTLQLMEAGADVCSARVESGAPPGIRVRACGQ